MVDVGAPPGAARPPKASSVVAAVGRSGDARAGAEAARMAGYAMAPSVPTGTVAASATKPAVAPYGVTTKAAEPGAAGTPSPPTVTTAVSLAPVTPSAL